MNILYDDDFPADYSEVVKESMAPPRPEKITRTVSLPELPPDVVTEEPDEEAAAPPPTYDEAEELSEVSSNDGQSDQGNSDGPVSSSSRCFLLKMRQFLVVPTL